MSKFNLGDVVNVAFHGRVRGQLVTVYEVKTICGIIRVWKPGAGYDTIISYEYLVGKGPAFDVEERVTEDRISRIIPPGE